jgi:hypothetical protein
MPPQRKAGGDPEKTSGIKGQTLTERARPSYDFIADPLIFLFLAFGAPITTMLGLLAGQRTLLPLMNAAVIFPFFALAVRRGRLARAVGFTLAWAACQALSIVILTWAVPERAEYGVSQGIEYRAAMMQWLATGQSSETTLASFLPTYARDLGLLVLASLISGGLGGLFIIAKLLNYTGFYVAHLATYASHPLLLAFVAWPIWMLARVAGYSACCAVLAEPLLRLDWRAPLRRWRLLALGLSLIAAEAVFRIFLAPISLMLLRWATDWA